MATDIKQLLPSQAGNSGKVLSTNGTSLSWIAASVGSVTSVSVVTNQGISGVVTTPTTTPVITLSIGVLTGVTSFNGLVITANTGVITTGTWSASTIAATRGGTGQTVYVIGDILYADTTTTLAKRADVATGNALISGGVGVAPTYGKIGLTTHVSGVLPIANGGTNSSTALLNNRIIISSAGTIKEHSAQVTNQIAYYNASGLPTGDVGFTREVLTSSTSSNPTIRSQDTVGAPVLNLVGDAIGADSGLSAIAFWDSTATTFFGLVYDTTNAVLTIGLSGVFTITDTGITSISTSVGGSGAGISSILNLGISSTANGQLNLAAGGAAPTTPIDGDIFYVGTDLFMRRGATTSTFHFLGEALTLNYVAVAGTYTALATDDTINATSGTFTVNLPTAVGITGKIYIVKNSGAGTITLDAAGTETIDGSLTATLISFVSLTVQSTGANWIII